MAKITMSFIIEEEQKAQVEALAAMQDSSVSSTMRHIIKVGTPIVEAAHRRRVQQYARQIAEAVREERVALLPEGGIED